MRDFDERRAFSRAVREALEQLEQFYDAAVDRLAPAVRLQRIEDIASELDVNRWVREGGLLGEGFAPFLERYLDSCTRLHHPGYMAHQVATPHLAGAVAGLIDSFTNNVMAIYEMGPAASCIEYSMINWMLRKVGWRPAPWPREPRGAGPYGGGVLTHGGSLANLTALLAARGRIAPDAWKEGNPPRLGVLASEHAHYSVTRAVSVLGLGQRSIFDLPSDETGAVIPARMESIYGRMVEAGYTPLCLVANACCTPTGRYDPLEEVANFCREKGIWLHVDGAHGAAALLSPRLRHLLRGVELADSMVWDAHKMLRSASLCAAVLVRDASDLDRAFQQEASYLIHEKEQPGFDFLNRTVECTKAGLGLKMFLPLAALGERRMGAFVERQYALTHRAWEMIRGRPGFDCPVEPQANILIFRRGGGDEQQLRIRDRLVRDGRFHVSSTAFRGARYLRVVLINPRTDESTIEGLIEAIERGNSK